MKVSLTKQTDNAEGKIWYIVQIGTTGKFFIDKEDAQKLFDRIKEHGTDKIEEELDSFEIPGGVE